MPSSFYLGGLSLLLALTSKASAFEIALYNGPRCSAITADVVVMGPDQGCHQNAAGFASSAYVGSTGTVDETFYVVFFESGDCDPDTVVANVDEGCHEVNYGSFAVWDICKPGEIGCLG